MNRTRQPDRLCLHLRAISKIPSGNMSSEKALMCWGGGVELLFNGVDVSPHHVEQAKIKLDPLLAVFWAHTSNAKQDITYKSVGHFVSSDNR